MTLTLSDMATVVNLKAKGRVMRSGDSGESLRIVCQRSSQVTECYLHGMQRLSCGWTCS